MADSTTAATLTTSTAAAASATAPATTSATEAPSTGSADANSATTAAMLATSGTATTTTLLTRLSVTFDSVVHTIDAPPATETATNDDAADDATASEGDDEDGIAPDHASPAADASLTRLDPADDIDALFAEAETLASSMAEATPMATHVLERIQFIRTHASHLQDCDWETLRQIVGAYVTLLREFANEPIGAYRLVRHPTVAAQIKAVHDALDSLARGATIAVESWEPRWTACRNVQFKTFVDKSRDRPFLLGNTNLSADEKATILLFVIHEIRRAEGVHSPKWHDVLKTTRDRLLRLTNSVSPVVETWFLPKYDLVISDKLLGSGGFADVYYATYLGTVVVAKFLKPQRGAALDTAAFVKEANTWFRANKVPNVIRFFGAYHLGAKPFFVSEYATHGTLAAYLAKHKHRTWALLLQAAHGLYGLHQLDIFHNDLKCTNILVTTDGVAKLTDFGLSLALIEDRGACRWKAPEVFAGKREGTRASDTYSFGMCIVEAVSHALPWGAMADVCVRKYVREGKLPTRPSGFTDEQWALVRAMCAFTPEDRLGMSDVLAKLQKFADDEFNTQLQSDATPPVAGISRLPSRRVAVAPLPRCETVRPAHQDPETELKPSVDHDGATTAPTDSHQVGSTAAKRQDTATCLSAVELSVSASLLAPHAPAAAAEEEEDRVVAASVDDHRFATVGRREVVEYRVTLRMERGRVAVVWKRFSNFRFVHRHLQAASLRQSLSPFPHRTPFWATRSQATIDQRTSALSAYLASVVATSGVPLGVRLSDTEVVYKSSEKPKYVL